MNNTPTPLTAEQKAELENKIRDSIPNDESRELKFGCRIRKGKEFIYDGSIHIDWEYLTFIDRCKNRKMAFCLSGSGEMGDRIESRTMQKHKKLDFEIIGRELQLSDVLIALEKHEGKRAIFVYPTGQLARHGWKANHIDYDAKYDLTKPYSQQSEEFYVFLYQLLCG